MSRRSDPTRGVAVAVAFVAAVAVAAPGCGSPVAPIDTVEAVGAVPEQTPPPGLEFVPPAPGTYELPVIRRAGDGEVVDADGSARRLSDYLGDRYVLLSFVYLNCADATGCPLATASFHMIRDDVESDPELAGKVRLVTLSFDPDRDTPESMLEHGDRAYLDEEWDERPWSLLTTGSREEIQPILDGYGQYVVREIDETGRETGDFSHVLKVFLIDRELRVRNVYSTAYMHPAIAVNDLKTLVRSDGTASG